MPTVLTWLQAYNAAKARSIPGTNGPVYGYLATLTEINEQVFVYTSISRSPGWLGGTRMLKAAGNAKINNENAISATASDYIINTGIADKWYWACGPEAGTVFYNTPRYDAVKGAVPGVFNFWSNPVVYAAYTAY